MRPTSTLAILASLATAACVAAQTPLKRYDSFEGGLPGGAPKLLLHVFVTAPPLRPLRPSILALEAEGQAAFIEAIARGGDSAKAVRAELSPAKVDGRNDLLRESRIVMTVDSEGFGLADRIDELTLEFELEGERTGTLLGWSGYSDDAVTIELGSITASQSTTLSAGVGAAFGASTALENLTQTRSIMPSVNLAVNASRQEAAQLRRILQPVNRFDESGFSIRRFGAADRDLVGTSTIDLTLSTAPKGVGARAETYVAQIGSTGTLPALSARLNTSPITFNPLCNPVEAQVAYRARIRKVIDGAATFTESDDKVEYLDVEGRIEDPITLFSATQTCPKLYELLGEDGVLSFRTDPGSPEGAIRFASRDEARRFAAWLARTASRGATLRIANGEIGWSSEYDDFGPLPPDYRQLVVSAFP